MEVWGEREMDVQEGSAQITIITTHINLITRGEINYSRCE